MVKGILLVTRQRGAYLRNFLCATLVLMGVASCSGFAYYRSRPVILGGVDGAVFRGRFMREHDDGGYTTILLGSGDDRVVQWDFGDGNTYHQEDADAIVSHTFVNAGTYVVFAAVFEPNGSRGYNADGDWIAAKLTVTVPAVEPHAEN